MPAPAGGAHDPVCNHRQTTNQRRFRTAEFKHGQCFANLFCQVGHVYREKWRAAVIIACRTENLGSGSSRRRPHAQWQKIAAEKAGLAVTDRAFIAVGIQLRTNVPHIFAIGDIVGQPMLAHKAVHEAHVAAEVALGSCTDVPPVRK